MESAPILASLSRLPHFRLLEEAQLREIAAGARLVTRRKSEVIFRAGDPCRAFFVVRSGAVQAFRLTLEGTRRVVHHFLPGQSFGEAALLSLGTFPVTAEALESPTELVEVRGEPFLALLRRDQRTTEAILASLCMRLLMLVERVEELSVASSAARLAGYLLRLPAHRENSEPSVCLPVSKKDLAAHLSITPETLSRILRRWRDRGLVATSGRTIVLREARVLEALADQDESTAV